MAISWQGVSIPPHGLVCRSVQVNLDYWHYRSLTPSFTVSAFSNPLSPTDYLSISGTVYGGTSLALKYWMTVDLKMSTLAPMNTSAYAGVSVYFSLRISNCPFSDGSHTLNIFGVSVDGDISEPFNVSVTISGMGSREDDAAGARAQTWEVVHSGQTFYIVAMAVAPTVGIIIIVGIIAVCLRRRRNADDSSPATA
jgi:hypothetical protein